VRRVAPLLALVAAALAAGAVVLAGNDGRSEPARTGPRLLGLTDPGRTVEFRLALRQDRRAVARFLRALNDPSSPRYRDFIGAAEFGRRFGPSDAELRRARAALAAAGLEIAAAYPQRTSLGVRGRARDVSRLLGVRLGEWRDARGRRWRAPLGRPRLPASLRPAVTAATGLDTRPLFRPRAVPVAGLKPRDAAAAYNITPLHDRGLRGQGQTIAIVSFDSFRDEDVAEYDRLVGIRGAPPVERAPLEQPLPPGPGQDEVNLDIDVIRGIAPRAQIVNYEMPNDGRGFAPIVEKVVNDGRVTIMSNSWGVCAVAYPPELRDQDEAALAAAVARGITMFVASGDAGAYDCQHGNPDDLRLSVDWPSSSPNAVAVGGTLLNVRRDGSYFYETGWEDPLSGGGGGGGLSTIFDRPPWQRGPGVNNRRSTGKRQVPDVAASSDGDSGWFVVTQGQVAKIGGTSAAAPFWSASMLLVTAHARREGAGRMPYANPLLYRIAARRDSPFNDVTRGGNRGYRATRGWDYATGLGSPDVAALADRVVEDLRRTQR
jgi:subtilase family serine protease